MIIIAVKNTYNYDVKAAGTWSVYMTGTNIASPSLGSAFIGGTKYSRPKMTIKYILE